VSRGIKALLIEWGIDHARDIRTVERAADVLQQPGDSLPHDDHFHVRIYCPTNGEGAFCVDTGPLWPWVEKKRAETMSVLTDERILEAALEGV
jgi:penicillin-insensitive murein endopeptidase